MMLDENKKRQEIGDHLTSILKCIEEDNEEFNINLDIQEIQEFISSLKGP